MCPKLCVRRKELLIRTRILRGSGARPARRSRKRTQKPLKQKLNVPAERWRQVPAAALLLTAHTCNRLAFCLFSTYEIARCDETGLLACDRMRLRPPTRVAAAPT